MPRRRWKPLFLEALANSGNVRVACNAAGIERSTAYRARTKDEAFKKKWDVAIDDAADLLEAEAYRRAIQGVDRPVFYRGIQVGTVRAYSDPLLIFLLKGARPYKYREASADKDEPAQSKGAILELVEGLRKEHAG